MTIWYRFKDKKLSKNGWTKRNGQVVLEYGNPFEDEDPNQDDLGKNFGMVWVSLEIVLIVDFSYPKIKYFPSLSLCFSLSVDELQQYWMLDIVNGLQYFNDVEA